MASYTSYTLADGSRTSPEYQQLYRSPACQGTVAFWPGNMSTNFPGACPSNAVVPVDGSFVNNSYDNNPPVLYETGWKCQECVDFFESCKEYMRSGSTAGKLEHHCLHKKVFVKFVKNEGS